MQALSSRAEVRRRCSISPIERSLSTSRTKRCSQTFRHLRSFGLREGATMGKKAAHTLHAPKRLIPCLNSIHIGRVAEIRMVCQYACSTCQSSLKVPYHTGRSVALRLPGGILHQQPNRRVPTCCSYQQCTMTAWCDRCSRCALSRPTDQTQSTR